MNKIKETIVEEFKVRPLPHTDEMCDEDTKWLEKALTQLEKTVREEVEKAFGGCTNCYGKGYSTIKDFTEGFDDFAREGFVHENSPYKPCKKCDRGKQFEVVLKTLNK